MRIVIQDSGYGFENEDTWRHPIYTVYEANEQGIRYKENWKDAQEGDWLLTTDNFVLQCLKRGPSKCGQDWIRTCIGTFSMSSNVCDTKYRENRYTFSGKKQWSPDVEKSKCSVQERMFAWEVGYGAAPEDAWKTVWFGSWLNLKHKEKAREFALALLQRPHVRREVEYFKKEKEAQDEITAQWLTTEGKDIYERAKKEGDYKTARDLLKFLGDLKGFKKHELPDTPPPLSEEKKAELEAKKQEQLRKESDDAEEIDEVHTESESTAAEEGSQES